ncbi:hypothetical protein JTE90_007770 [Oedothorax gibbosus]|uniref:MYND-type domain-containing protein n=1 Tax=Oedothorax gibbosus TaxID=931172 RepID=A0AAV6TSC4_9ARAC|nr:hypothetical protein JTE90_007770 [Oedothorax gibbosus]
MWLDTADPTVTRGYLKNLLKRQDGALGRTHLHRMQTLAKLYSPEQPELSKEEMRAGIVELTESMKEVWGDYHPELAMYYRWLVDLNRELGNEKEARQYYFKLWRLESVIYGAFFIDNRWEGDVIHEEKPFIRVLKQDLWDKICAGCCAKSTGLKKCSGCSVMKYCGKSCQKNDWPDHKLECPHLRNYTDFRNHDLVHMIGKLILKLKGKDWKTATSRIFDVDVSFDDLLSQADYVLQNLEFEALDITTPLESFIGKENVPDKEILKDLFGKVVTNRFVFSCGKYPFGNDFENICVNYHRFMQILGGTALFLGVSKIKTLRVFPNAFFPAARCFDNIREI